MSDSDQDRTVVASTQRSMVLGPGSKILNDTYVIEKVVGKGGMGEVFQAEHIELGAKRAIKIILPEFAKNTQYVGLFIEEARKLSRVNNDAIVRYYEFSRDELGARYLVMEYVDGESLAAVLERRRLDPAEVRTLLERLAQGLAAAYEQGIRAHRDISPANILLPHGRVDQAKVIDFGIAKSADPAGGTLIGSDFAGKYSFVSPEQVGLFGGQDQVNEISDLYSLGLLLAAAAMGFSKRLDMGNEPASVIKARQAVPDLGAIPAELRPLLTRMLQPRPEDRPQSMRALIEESRRLASPASAAKVAAPSDGAVRPAAPNRKPVWLAISGLAGLAALTGVAIVVLRPGSSVVTAPPAKEEPGLKPLAPIAPSVATTTPPVQSPGTQQPAPALPPAAEPAPSPAEKPGTQVVSPVVPPPVPVAPPDPRAELVDAMKQLDCAAVHAGNSASGAELISGTVPSAEDRAKLVAIAARLPTDARPDIRVDIVPPPVCRAVSGFDRIQGAGLLSNDGIELRLARGVQVLHEGDPIAVEVKSRRDYPVFLRIDYFTLGGEVLHMWPNADMPTAKLAAGETREFLKGPGNQVWQVGSAPFGTELITVTATPATLDLGGPRSVVEPASDYLNDLKSALGRVSPPAGQPDVAATLLIHTSAK